MAALTPQPTVALSRGIRTPSRATDAPCARRRSIPGLLLLLLLALAVPVHAAAPPPTLTLLFVLSADREPFRGVVTGFLSAPPTERTRIETLSVADPRLAQALTRSDLVLPVGDAASATIAAWGLAAPVIHTLVTRQRFKELIRLPGGPRSAIYIDQPAIRYLALVDALDPNYSTVGVILGRDTENRRGELQIEARRLGLGATVLVNTGETPIAQSIRQLPPDVRALLALPDRDIHDPGNVKGLLIASYRRGTPVVAFSPAYVRAGAVAAVFTTPRQVGLQLGDMVERYLSTGARRLPSPEHPNRATVITNFEVARHLDLALPSTADLLSRLRAVDHTLR